MSVVQGLPEWSEEEEDWRQCFNVWVEKRRKIRENATQFSEGKSNNEVELSDGDTTFESERKKVEESFTVECDVTNFLSGNNLRQRVTFEKDSFVSGKPARTELQCVQRKQGPKFKSRPGVKLKPSQTKGRHQSGVKFRSAIWRYRPPRPDSVETEPSSFGSQALRWKVRCKSTTFRRRPPRKAIRSPERLRKDKSGVFVPNFLTLPVF